MELRDFIRDVKDFPFPPGDLPDLRQQGTLFQEFAGVSTGRQPLVGDGEARVTGATQESLVLIG